MSGPEDTRLVIFRVGSVVCTVPVLDVEQIVPPPDRLTSLPWAPPEIKGVFPYRSRAALAISLHHKFGLPDREDSSTGELLVALVDGAVAALWVDLVMDVISSELLERVPLPKSLSTAVFSGALLRDGGIALATSADALFRMPCAVSPISTTVGADTEQIAAPPAEDVSSAEDARPPVVEDASEGIESVEPAPQVATTSDDSAPATIDRPAGFRRQPVPPRRFPDRDAVPHRRWRSAERANPRDSATTQTHRGGERHDRPLRESIRVVTPARAMVRDTTAGERPDSGSHPKSGKRNNVWGPLTFVAIAAAVVLGFALLRPMFTSDGDSFAAAATFTSDGDSFAAAARERARAQSGLNRTAADRNSSTAVARERTSARSDVNRAVAGSERPATRRTTPEPPGRAESDVVAKPPQPSDFTATPNSGQPGSIRPVVTVVVGTADLAAVPPATGGPRPADGPGRTILHVVKKGDTLWDICEHYLGDAFQYPRVARTSGIVDPHWIEPGDLVRIIVIQ